MSEEAEKVLPLLLASETCIGELGTQDPFGSAAKNPSTGSFQDDEILVCGLRFDEERTNQLLVVLRERTDLLPNPELVSLGLRAGEKHLRSKGGSDAREEVDSLAR